MNQIKVGQIFKRKLNSDNETYCITVTKVKSDSIQYIKNGEFKNKKDKKCLWFSKSNFFDYFDLIK